MEKIHLTSTSEYNSENPENETELLASLKKLIHTKAKAEGVLVWHQKTFDFVNKLVETSGLTNKELHGYKLFHIIMGSSDLSKAPKFDLEDGTIRNFIEKEL